MDLEARRQMEQRITIAAAEGLVAAGCTVSVIEGDTVHLSESTDPLAIDSALHLSGEPGFYVKREIKGRMVEGWVDFIGYGCIEVTTDECLDLAEALQPANRLAFELQGISGHQAD